MTAELRAEPQTAGQRTEVSRLIPAVSVARGPKTITASAKTVVNWQDLVNTQANPRIALDDGSALNVGSESSMKIVKHDAGAQQTELELTYGKLGTQAQQIAKRDGKFEVRTPAGVAPCATGQFRPLPPAQATLDLLVASSNDTNPGEASGVIGAGPDLGVWGTVGIGAGAIGAGLGVGLTRGGGSAPLPVPKGGCSPNNPKAR